jgi:hypothetical protein
LQVGPPQIDAELLTAGRRIRDLEGTRIPVVLTDAAAGTVLPGFFGERVYAGHWSLTPDFRTKTALLKRAGVEVSSPTGNGYDRDALAELVRDTRANYILLKRTAAAAQAIATCSHSEPVFEGERWIAVSASDWSCP